MPLLDALLARDEILILPGAYDALSARVAVRAGADAVYMSGFGVVGASFGVPDIGLIGSDQMAERVRAIAAAIAPIPLIADGDNGHGGPANVARLVRAYEQAGAACIQLEDQVSPKRCGHMDGKEVVTRAEAVAKVRAAAATRASPTFKIMARTDARQTHGLDEALSRGEAFLRAGADILFIEAPQSEMELRMIAESFAGTPLVANLVEDGKTPVLAPADLFAMGFKIALYPVSALLAVARRLEDVYASLLVGKAIDPQQRSTFAHYNELVGLAHWRQLADVFNESD
jgi:2-methylisocitrate lyase-like PEP mutase family enzyme